MKKIDTVYERLAYTFTQVVHKLSLNFFTHVNACKKKSRFSGNLSCGCLVKVRTMARLNFPVFFKVHHNWQNESDSKDFQMSAYTYICLEIFHDRRIPFLKHLLFRRRICLALRALSYTCIHEIRPRKYLLSPTRAPILTG